MRLQAITREMLENAVAIQATDEFDTHDVIFALMRQQARAYVAELYEALHDDSDPFVSFHTAIGMALAGMPDVVTKQPYERRSLNLKGQQSEARVWRRVRR